MFMGGLKSYINILENIGELVRIQEFVDPVLEISEVTDRISKLPGGGKAILFESNGTRFPLLINSMGSEKRMATALHHENLESIGKEITTLFHGIISPKENLLAKLKILPLLKEVSSWVPVKLKRKGSCQEFMITPPDLFSLPVLKCWPADGGRFITLPAVHTVDPETGYPNVGMYRMQLFDKNLTGMHWHRHKTGAVHFEKYRKLGMKMPVSVTLGGDPVYTYAATAPMPENMDEYLLAGFLRKRKIRLVKCLTNDLYVPDDVDFVIEGTVDPSEEFVREGPFGDHTGFYSLPDNYPVFHVTCITHRKDAVYPATIVGIPPMEDAWIGKATERIFLAPIRLSMIPELVDMDLPFAGVAHNISVIKIRKTYPGQAVKVMHSLWGAGQMMFNKILVVVDDTAGSTNPKSEITDVHDYSVLSRLFSENFDPAYSLHFSKGPLDILDHSSDAFAYGSKLGIDLTRPLPEEITENKSNSKNVSGWDINAVGELPGVTRFRNLLAENLLPVLLLSTDKTPFFCKKELEKELSKIPGMEFFKAVVVFDHEADLNDLFMLVWLLGGNIEPTRDITVLNTPAETSFVLADATIKTPRHDHFTRDWPNVVTMDDATIAAVDRKWPGLGLGDHISSPSLKYKALVKGEGAVRE